MRFLHEATAELCDNSQTDRQDMSLVQTLDSTERCYQIWRAEDNMESGVPWEGESKCMAREEMQNVNAREADKK